MATTIQSSLQRKEGGCLNLGAMPLGVKRLLESNWERSTSLSRMAVVLSAESPVEAGAQRMGSKASFFGQNNGLV